MINTKKFINSSVKESKDIFQDLLIPITKRDGFVKNQSPIIPVYFYRYVGIGENEKNYYDNLNKLDERLSKFENGYKRFLLNIPLENDADIIRKSANIWTNISVLNNSQVNNLLNLINDSGVFPNLNDELLNSSLQEAFSYVLKLFITNSKNINITQIKNFSLKQLQWINKYIPKMVVGLDYKHTEGKEIYNPKVLYYGDIKKHEVYFLILLSKIGCDILYVNTNTDEAFQKIDKDNKCSKTYILPKRAEIKEFPIYSKPQHKKNVSSSQYQNTVQNSTSTVNRTGKISSNDTLLNRDSLDRALHGSDKVNANLKPIDKGAALEIINSPNGIMTSLKKSSNILKDIQTPLNSRVGFSSGSNPRIPIYFYRYIGVKNNKDAYHNEIFGLDRNLSKLGSIYLKITEAIPLAASSELTKKTDFIWKNFSDYTQKDFLISALVQAKAFPNMNSKVLEISVIKAFNEILELFLNNETNVNAAKVKNFSLKILLWMNKYIFELFNKFKYEENGNDNIYNPKILYYGDIKKHEAYFLILLSKLGCDIIFINTHNDSVFSLIDKKCIYSHNVELSDRCEIKEFPKEEIYIRHETTAYQASEQISKVLYSDEVGIYKPWQFENYNLKPITLKTTFEELKLLWNEPANVRSGFKVENGTVYVPNLFAKISGVHEELNLYCEEFLKFKSSENTMFIPKIPFTKAAYSRNELYTLIRLFNKDGFINKEKLMEDKLYKYSYLKTSIQDTMIDKINSLIKLKIFKKSSDKELILKILMVVLNLDKKILELIQLYDYPNKIPKLIIFDNDESIFSDEDCIVLAFLNQMGFDIIIFTPTGYNNIEQKISEKYYDIHTLSKIKLDLELSQLENSKVKFNSFWKGLFRKNN